MAETVVILNWLCLRDILSVVYPCQSKRIATCRHYFDVLILEIPVIVFSNSTVVYY